MERGKVKEKDKGLLFKKKKKLVKIKRCLLLHKQVFKKEIKRDRKRLGLGLKEEENDSEFCLFCFESSILSNANCELLMLKQQPGVLKFSQCSNSKKDRIIKDLLYAVLSYIF